MADVNQNTLVNTILNKIYCFSVNHKNAPLSLIGKLQLTNVENEERSLKEKLNAKELIILQTCNRFEIYCYVNDENSIEYIMNYFTQLAGYNIEDYITIMKGRDAIEHLFRVAAGLESLIIGEWEIVDQVKDALKIAGRANSSGKILNTLFRKAADIGTSVRNNMKGMIGIPEMAVNYVHDLLGGLDGKQVMIIGTGKAASAIIRSISMFKIKKLIVAGRSVEKANELAAIVNGYGIPLTEVSSMLRNVDVVFVAISGKHFTLQINEDSIPLIVDISIPPSITYHTNNSRIITLKTLENKIQQNIDKDWVQYTEQYIKESMMSLDKFLIRIAINDFVSKLMMYVERSRREAVSYALRKLRNGDNAEIVIDSMSKSLVKHSMQPIIESILSLAYKEDETVLRLLKYINNSIRD